jgi:hypothetical protein
MNTPGAWTARRWLGKASQRPEVRVYASFTIDVMKRRVGSQRDTSKARYGQTHDELVEESWWLALAASAFAKDWDNDLDAIYDGWKLLYPQHGSRTVEGTDAH